MSNLENLKLLVESIENQDVILLNMRSKQSGKHNIKYTIVVSDKEPRNKEPRNESKKEKFILEPKQPKSPVAPPRIGLAEITSIGTV